MKRIPLLILALTLCLVALSWKNAEAGLACSATLRNTTATTGYGTSCTHSQNDLYNKAAAKINCGLFDSCFQNLVITTSCRLSGTQYRTDGYIQYKCYYCASSPCSF